MVRDCLEDDFSGLLDRSGIGPSRFLVPATNDHVRYAQRYGRDVVFAHHDLTLDDDFERMHRAVFRFNSVLRDQSHKLLLMITERKRLTAEGYRDLLEAIRANARNAVLLAIRVGPSHPCGKMELIDECADGRLLDFSPMTAIGGGGFECDMDNEAIRLLLAEYDLPPASLAA